MGNSFRQCILNICGLEMATLAVGVKYSVYCNKFVIVEGHGGISDYSPQKVTFFCGKSALIVYGENLKIKCLEKHYAVVEGVIEAVKNER